MLQSRVRTASLWSWALIAFSLPFSTALTLIFSALGTFLGILSIDRTVAKRVMGHPISICCVALFMWLALSALWSIAPQPELIEGISKYRKLLYVPVVAMVLMAANVKPWFLIKFFVVSCVLVCLGSLGSYSGFYEYLLGPQLPGGGWGILGSKESYLFYIGPPYHPTFGRSYIAQGAFLVFSAIYLVGVLIHESQTRLLSRSTTSFLLTIGLIIFIVFTVSNLGGRTGYVLFLIGALAWLLKLHLSGLTKSALRLLGAALLAVLVVVVTNKNVSTRFITAVHEASQYPATGELTSQGERLNFWKVGILAGTEEPIFGSGVGSYPEIFGRDPQQPPQLRATRPHPHSEYVLQLVQGGTVGLLLFCAILFLVTREFLILRAHHSEELIWKTSAIGIIVVTLFVDGVFNSVLWDLAEGHSFPLFLGSFVACTLSVDSERWRSPPAPLANCHG